jgi:hypothetical protein
MKQLISEIKLFRKKLGELLPVFDSGRHDTMQQDTARIHISSKLLQISEFRFFQLSYSQWYGRELPERSMEYIFADYMFKDEIPHWARYFSRKVLSLYFKNRLNPREFNLNCTIPPRPLKRSELPKIFVLLSIYLIFYIILSGQIAFP